MRQVRSRYDVFYEFGMKKTPFLNVGQMNTSDVDRINRIIGMVVADHGMICVVGDRGSGKSVSIEAALKKQGCKLVKVWSLNKNRVLIGDVEHALIHELSDERPKRIKEVRSLQLRRILGEASRRHRIVVVIEEAHFLHHLTLRALKAMRELEWMGRKELVTVVLIGQSDALAREGLAEVRLRADTIRMSGLLYDEIREYIRQSLGEIVSETAADKIAKMREAQNYLDLQVLLVEAMDRALNEGRKVVQPEDVGVEAPAAKVEERDTKTALSSVLKARKTG